MSAMIYTIDSPKPPELQDALNQCIFTDGDEESVEITYNATPPRQPGRDEGELEFKLQTTIPKGAYTVMQTGAFPFLQNDVVVWMSREMNRRLLDSHGPWVCGNPHCQQEAAPAIAFVCLPFFDIGDRQIHDSYLLPICKDPVCSTEARQHVRAKSQSLLSSVDEECLTGIHCEACAKPQLLSERRFYRCSRCQVAYYCCKLCQKKDWRRIHRTKCTPPSHDSNNGAV